MRDAGNDAADRRPDLDRFLVAQDRVYPQVIAELGAGEKRSHWIWFVFPQLRGLGLSATAAHYGISGLDEARAYLVHPTLSARLAECTEITLGWAGRKSARDIFGDTDAMKLRSSMTLFERASAETEPRFAQLLDAYYEGQRDARTLAMLASRNEAREG